MPVLALWSAPRARSTVFFRSIVERGDLIALHEPFSNLADFGETDIEGRTVDSPASLLTWLTDREHDLRVFLKDTTDRRHGAVLTNRRFLTETRHAFLIRRPEEIAVSFYALKPDMRIDHIGLEALHELYTAVRDAGGHRPVVVDSDDLVQRPEATMAAYCAAVELPFIPQALTWEPGQRPEWRRSARWHAEVQASSGFEQRDHGYPHTAENSDELARFAAHHRPFYEQLHAQRLNVTAWVPMLSCSRQCVSSRGTGLSSTQDRPLNSGRQQWRRTDAPRTAESWHEAQARGRQHRHPSSQGQRHDCRAPETERARTDEARRGTGYGA